PSERLENEKIQQLFNTIPYTEVKFALSLLKVRRYRGPSDYSAKRLFREENGGVRCGIMLYFANSTVF
ncbi:hypothetical protein ACFL6U_17955, partial [Planctomycetota bacterium]